MAMRTGKRNLHVYRLVRRDCARRRPGQLNEVVVVAFDDQRARSLVAEHYGAEWLNEELIQCLPVLPAVVEEIVCEAFDGGG